MTHDVLTNREEHHVIAAKSLTHDLTISVLLSLNGSDIPLVLYFSSIGCCLLCHSVIYSCPGFERTTEHTTGTIPLPTKIIATNTQEDNYTDTLVPGGGGNPLQGLNGDVWPVRVCFSGFLPLTGYRFYHFVLNKVPFLGKFHKQGIVLGFKQGIQTRTIYVLNRVRVRGAGPHLPTQGYIE